MKNIKIFLTFLCLFAFANFASAQNVGDNKMYQGIVSTNASGNLMVLTKINGVNTYIKINNPTKTQVLIDKGAGFLPSSYSSIKEGDMINVYGKIKEKGTGIIAIDANTLMSSDVSSFFDVWAEVPMGKKKGTSDIGSFFDVFLESAVGRAKQGDKNSQQVLSSFFDIYMDSIMNKTKTSEIQMREKIMSSFFDIYMDSIMNKANLGDKKSKDVLNMWYKWKGWDLDGQGSENKTNSTGLLGDRRSGGSPVGGGLERRATSTTSTPPRQPSTGEGRGRASTSTPPTPKPTPTPTSTPGKQPATGNSVITPIIPNTNTSVPTFTIPSTNIITPTQTNNINSADSFFDVWAEVPLSAPVSVPVESTTINSSNVWNRNFTIQY